MDTDNNALILVDNNGSFEIDDPTDMDVDGNENNAITMFTPTTPVADADDSALINPDTQPNKRRRKKSIVWEHFTIETVSPGSTKAFCKHCKKSFAYITGSKLAGTSHLKRHIALGICPVSRQNLELTQTPETKTRSTGPKKRYRSSPGYTSIPVDQDRCNHEMAKMIILHEYPLHMVEHPGFAGFVQALQPQFNMASFNTIHGDCVSMYLLEKQKLSEFIRGIPGRVNLTLDLWASNQSLGYAFLTGHFIDNDWILHRRLLNVLVVPSPDSDFAFNQPVAACLSDWNLERRVSSLTVDQSIGNERAIENLRGFLSAKNPHVLDGQLLIGKCYARVLSSMAQDVLGSEELETPIMKVRDSVKYVKTNDSLEDRFYEVKRQLRNTSTKDILIDDQTKWNTTYNMLVAACEHKEVFSCLETCDPEYRIAPTFEEWKKIEILCGCLKLLFDAANVLTGPALPTANDLYHEVTKLQLELTHAAMNEDPEVRNLANPLREKFDEYWKGCFLVLAVAVVMDPRFKMKLIEFSFSKIYGEDAGQWIKTVDDGIHDLYLDYTAQHYPLLDAYVDNGNNSISETELSHEVHFHQELPHEHHHANGVSQDRSLDMLPQEVNHVYGQPHSSDSNPHSVQPQDGHPQDLPLDGQSQDGYPADDQPQEGPSLAVCQHPTHGPQEADAPDAQPQGGESVEQSVSEGCHQPGALPQEGQRAEAPTREGLPAEPNPQEGLPAEPNPQEGLPAEPNPQEGLPAEPNPQEGLPAEPNPQEGLPAEPSPLEGQPAEEVPQEGRSAEATQEGHPADTLPLEDQQADVDDLQPVTLTPEALPEGGQHCEALPQESQPMEGLAQEGQPTKTESQVDQPVDGPSQEGQLTEAVPQEHHSLEGVSQQIQTMEGLAQENQFTVGPSQEDQPIEGTQQENLSVEGTHQESHPMEGPLQESHSVEVTSQESQPLEGMPQESQPVEGMPQESQLTEHMLEEKQTTEEFSQEGEPAEGLPQEPQYTEDLPHESQSSEGLPTEGQHAEEGHQVDVLLQEGHHLEASSQDFPLITIGDGFSDFELYISEISSHQQMKSELDQYLEESLMPRSQDFDILGWWKLNRTKYPTLSKMAADILSVPFSTLTPDSVFDTKMKKMDNYRSCLRPVTLEALICAKDWLQYGSSAPENHNANMKTES